MFIEGLLIGLLIGVVVSWIIIKLAIRHGLWQDGIEEDIDELIWLRESERNLKTKGK